MFKRTLTGLLLAACTSAIAYGDIEEWSGAGGGYTINQFDKTILITAAGTYKFQAYNGNDTADIEWIHVQSGVGNVEVHVYQDPNDGDGPGAFDLKEINLTATGVTGVIGKVVLANDLAEDGIVFANTLDGPVRVEGEILHDIQIACLAGDIECANMRNLSMYGSESQPHPPSIHVDGTYQHRIEMNATLRSATICTISLGGGLGAYGELDLYELHNLWIFGDCLGEILIRENVDNVMIGGAEFENTIIDGTIHILGNVNDMDLYSDVYGDIYIDGNADIDTWPIHDFYGTLDIGGIGDVIIDGNVYDSGNNYIHIAKLDQFQCINLELFDDCDRWLTFDSDEGWIDGVVAINGTLSGVIQFNELFAGELYVLEIDAGETGRPDMPYGGVYFKRNTAPICEITIGDIRRGWVFADPADACDTVQGNVLVGRIGRETQPGVARILIGHADTQDTSPIRFGWDMTINQDVWPSGDGLPAVYAPGNLNGSILMNSSSLYTGRLMPGAVIQIDGDLETEAHITVHEIPMMGEIRIGGDVYGIIGCSGMAQTGILRENGDVKVAGNLGEYPYDVHIDRLEGSLEVGDKVGNVTIEEWAYSAGSKIDIAGDCGALSIIGDCPGDILIIRRIFGCKPVADDARRGL